MVNEVLRLIQTHRKNNPILSREIEGLLHMAGPAVRDAIRQLRRLGEPIVATEHGYYLASTPEEVTIVIDDLRARASSMQKTIAALQKRAYERFGGRQGRFLFREPNSTIPADGQSAAAGAHSDRQEEGRGRDVLPMQLDRAEAAQGRFLGEGESYSLDGML